MLIYFKSEGRLYSALPFQFRCPVAPENLASTPGRHSGFVCVKSGDCPLAMSNVGAVPLVPTSCQAASN